MSGLERLGPRPWLVLGGGGVKGLAHIGAWRALREEAGRSGLDVEGIIGTSIGALVGACAASGMDWREQQERAQALQRSDILRVHRRAVWVNGVRQPSIFRGKALADYIRRTIPVSSWEDLERPLQVNAVDLETGETVWFGPHARTDRSLSEALYASAALPVFFPPARDGDTYLVDGGAGEALPIQRPLDLDATGVIAVDVGRGPQEDAERVVRDGMLAVHQRVFAIMSGRRRREKVRHWDGPPLLYVRPRLDGYSTFDFESVEFFIEEGHRAMAEALEEWRAGVSQPSRQWR